MIIPSPVPVLTSLILRCVLKVFFISFIFLVVIFNVMLVLVVVGFKFHVIVSYIQCMGSIVVR